MQYQKTIVAGALVVDVIYPAIHPRDSRTVRQHKKNLSSAAQQRLNLKHAWQQAEQILAANFIINDLICVLTYDDEHLPRSRQQALRQFGNFAERLRYARQDGDFRYFYNTEHKHTHRKGGEECSDSGRWHHHFVVNALSPKDEAQIRKAWGMGRVYFQRLQVDKNKNYESLARYLSKEPRDKLGHRLWSYSRSCRKPEKDTRRVSNDTAISVPEGAMVIEDTGAVQTAYGQYRYVKYILPGWLGKAKRPRISLGS